MPPRGEFSSKVEQKESTKMPPRWTEGLERSGPQHPNMSMRLGLARMAANQCL